MSKSFAVFSAIGADRVGIVDDLSGLMSASGGNIEESKMAVLGGEFSVMMLVSMDSSSMDGLSRSLPELEKRFNLMISLHRTKEPVPSGEGRPYQLETVSLDGFGIVHSVTAVLRSHGINIEDMETETLSAPHTGAPMFRIKAGIILKPDMSVNALKRDLESLEVSQDLDVSLKPVFPGRSE